MIDIYRLLSERAIFVEMASNWLNGHQKSEGETNQGNLIGLALDRFGRARRQTGSRQLRRFGELAPVSVARLTWLQTLCR
jgi:hypothetical protein